MVETQRYLLKAMASNYGDGPHSWDHLDREVCEKAAAEIIDLERQIVELRAERDEAIIRGDGWRSDCADWQSKAEAAEADKARLSEALRAVRQHFNVEHTEDGRIASIGHDSEALPKVIAILDAALSIVPATADGWRTCNGVTDGLVQKAMKGWQAEENERRFRGCAISETDLMRAALEAALASMMQERLP